MGFYKFCSRNAVPWEQVKVFGLWLGDVRNSMLPESEWLKLWNKFQE